MALPGVFYGTDYKRNYNFFWQLSPCIASVSVKDIFKLKKLQLSNISWLSFETQLALATPYISQLAKSVQLPDDEVEMDSYDVATVQYPVPKRIRMSDISVTYLEDTCNLVYQFHRNWMNVVKDKGFYLKPVRPFCLSGIYISTTKSVPELEFIATSSIISEKLNKFANSGAQNYNLNSISQQLSSAVDIRSLQTYPLIFPIRISRGTMDKGGKDLAYVTVTYKRYPNIIGKSPALSII